MAPKSFSESFYLFCSIIFLIASNIQVHANDNDRKVYIVYMGSFPEGEYLPSSHHLDILKQVQGERNASNNLVRSYTRSLNGFAARLTSKEVEELSGLREVVSVFPSEDLKPLTTRSWDFVGFSESAKRVARVESDVIIGIIDSGIWPESESFSDEGFSPPPKKWKGACLGGKNFKCNNKIIGARYYVKDNDNGARDTDGHGTHTASTAAGRVVKGANFYGLAKGNARGGVPSARIAVYNVCSGPRCQSDAVLAAFDDAIADGVDIISVSLGLLRVVEVYDDAVAIGSFHGMKSGILTTQAAGNSGDSQGSAALTISVAPWLITVAASTTDRRFLDRFTLGDGTTLLGNSINGFELNNTFFPLILGKDLQNHCTKYAAERCDVDCLDKSLAKGKIIVCVSESSLGTIKEVHPLGAIAIEDTNDFVPELVPLPGTIINTETGNKLISYMNSTKTPEVNIRKSEYIKDSTAPLVAYFSSRGPNQIIPDILKPDITAPGVSILAAYSPLGKVTQAEKDTRSVNFTILSGTSMACPHIAGSAAYVKSFHPNWSPSAIKSALMTTAWPMNATEIPQRELAYGAGQINPVQAVDPGLVYETFEEDYIQLLCNVGYSATQIRTISGNKNASCRNIKKGDGTKLNYPTMTAKVQEDKPLRITFPRTVTNVGHANSTYRVKVFKDAKINVDVVPEVLRFKSVGEKKSFVVDVAGRSLPLNSTVSGSVVWSDGIHNVRSPIFLYTQLLLLKT